MIFQRDSEYGNVLPGFIPDISWRNTVFGSQNVLCKSCMSSHTSSDHFSLMSDSRNNRIWQSNQILSPSESQNKMSINQGPGNSSSNCFFCYSCIFTLSRISAFSTISSFPVILVHSTFQSYYFYGINKKVVKAGLVEKSELLG